MLDVPKGSPAAQAGLRVRRKKWRRRRRRIVIGEQGTVRTFRGIEVGDIIVGLDR